MKRILKLSGALILDQFIAVIAGFMCVVLFEVLLKGTLFAQILYFIVAMAFFWYASYMSAFKSGFHDETRHDKNYKGKGYIFKGFIAGVISCIPLFALYLTCIYSYVTKNEMLKSVTEFYFIISSMYFNGSAVNIFPNHQSAVLPFVFIAIILVSTLGYIMGYKNIIVFDKFYKYISGNKE